MTVQQRACRVALTGVVQGVGFRPHVWRLARELSLSGWVRNTPAGVEAHVEGTADAVGDFLRRVATHAPPLARVDSVHSDTVSLLGQTEFAILESESDADLTTAIGADVGVCDDCSVELFDPTNRRWLHPFITCTHCGPRFTITRGLPYDRPQTSMAGFALCPACAEEYGDPASRRFHAQATCCPQCGPRLQLVTATGQSVATDPLTTAWKALAEGRILAIKGLGGFHLACDASQPDVVARLRLLKDREAKPFAVMVLNAASAARWVNVDPHAITLLESPARPIVLLPRRDQSSLGGVAPGLDHIGVMLPSTPIHFLLLHQAAGCPAGTDWLQCELDTALIMTSANPGGEPIVRDNDEALHRLGKIADAFLLHDRGIVARCDDSVLSVRDGARVFIRRSRGYAPQALRIPALQRRVVACGAHLKSAICLTRPGEAFLTPHIGDLDHAATCAFWDETLRRYLDLLRFTPEVVARDLHPDFFSSRVAEELAQRWQVPVLTVQHHHAHIAAVCAEHGIARPVLGLALDGVGLGHDGQAWGGELLCVDGGSCQRLGHLRPLVLPGGDAATHEPWRMALSVLCELGLVDEARRRFATQDPSGTLTRWIVDRTSSALVSTSMGRLFDAAAGLLGMTQRQPYEAQAAMRMESEARRYIQQAGSPQATGLAQITDDAVLDFLPVLGELAHEGDIGRGAARFHVEVLDGLARWVARTAQTTGVDVVALGGGCLYNRIMALGLCHGLAKMGLKVVMPEQVAPGDAGVALGQAWVAQCFMES